MDSRSISRFRLTKFYAHLPRETEPNSARWYKHTLHYWTMDVNKPLGLLGKCFFLNCTPIISDSTWRILPPQTMVVSLQYYLEYCTTLISPNCCPLEVSKGGLFLHVPYLCPTVSTMAGDMVESAWLGGCLMWGVCESVILHVLTFSRLRRNRTIKGSHIGLILSATYIIVAWKRYSPLFKTFLLIQRSREYIDKAII